MNPYGAVETLSLSTNISLTCVSMWKNTWYFSTVLTHNYCHRYNVLKAREDEIAAYEARMKPIWDAEKAAAAAKANREQLIILAKEVGQKVSFSLSAALKKALP